MNPWVILRRCGTAVLASALILAANVASAAETEVTIMHYFTADIGGAGLHPIFDKFKKETGITVVDSPIGHEDYKTGILVRAAGNSLPDIFSEWAGARTQFVVDTGKLEPLDALWAAQKLDSVVAKPVAASATIYNGKRYLIPIGYHYAAVFYNAKVLKDAGVTTMPKTWDEFVSLCKTLKAKGVTPFALGTKNRWPGQFWFDYLLLRTAGPEYRAKLVAGKASYTDPEVKKAMALWKDMRRCRVLRREFQRRRLDRRGGQGRQRPSGDDFDGHMDHRILDPEWIEGGRRLRFLRFPRRSIPQFRVLRSVRSTASSSPPRRKISRELKSLRR